MDRRRILQLGAAGALALAVTPHKGLASSIARREAPHRTIYKLIHDERYESGRAFARSAASFGAPSAGIQGDITDIWYNDLALRWRKEPAAIAGLTGFGAFFCLERLAWDAGMRVVFKAEHRRLADGRIEHRMTGALETLSQATWLGQKGADWSAAVPSLLLERPPRSRETSETTVTSPPFAHTAGEPDYLVSWVIEPVNRG